MSQDLLPLENPLLNTEAFNDFVTFRRKILKKPVKDLERLERKFSQWPKSVQRLAVDSSMDNDYQGVFFEKFAQAEEREAQQKPQGFIERHQDKSWADGL